MTVRVDPKLSAAFARALALPKSRVRARVFLRPDGGRSVNAEVWGRPLGALPTERVQELMALMATYGRRYPSGICDFSVRAPDGTGVCTIWVRPFSLPGEVEDDRSSR